MPQTDDLAVAPETAATREYTLVHAAACIDHESSEWDASRAPSRGAWVGLSKKLARAERAVSALTGLHDLLRQHRFASQNAVDCEAKYIGITDYQAGCIEDGIDLLIWDAVTALSDVREAATTQEER